MLAFGSLTAQLNFQTIKFFLWFSVYMKDVVDNLTMCSLRLRQISNLTLRITAAQLKKTEYLICLVQWK